MTDETAAAPNGLRSFASGANRDSDENKLDFEAFLSPAVLKAFATYMHGKRRLPDGSMRDGDNWQKGIPIPVYMKSMMRHFVDVWLHHRGLGEQAEEPLETALAGLFFNVQGYWHETLKSFSVEDATPVTPAEVAAFEDARRRAFNNAMDRYIEAISGPNPLNAAERGVPAYLDILRAAGFSIGD